MSGMRGLHAINITQPHLNDMTVIFRHTIDKGIKLLTKSCAEMESTGHPLRGQVFCAE